MEQNCKKNIISITGELGSGKSVVAKLLAKQFSFQYFVTGEIQRKIAANKNMNVLEMNKYAENHREIDDEIDSYTINLGREEDNFVIDSRMAWHFIPVAFNVYLFVSPNIASQRIGGDAKRSSESYSSSAEAAKFISMRRGSEHKRFLSLYGVDVFALSNYTLVVDTSYLTAEEVAQCIISQYKKWRNINLAGVKKSKGTATNDACVYAYLPMGVASGLAGINNLDINGLRGSVLLNNNGNNGETKEGERTFKIAIAQFNTQHLLSAHSTYEQQLASSNSSGNNSSGGKMAISTKEQMALLQVIV